METVTFCSPQPQQKQQGEPQLGSAERVCGMQSGEIFVRANRNLGLLLQATTNSGSGTLYDARPFVQELLGVGGEAAASAERHLVVQWWSAKIAHARALRRQIKVRLGILRVGSQPLTLPGLCRRGVQLFERKPSGLTNRSTGPQRRQELACVLELLRNRLGAHALR